VKDKHTQKAGQTGADNNGATYFIYYSVIRQNVIRMYSLCSTFRSSP